MSQVYTKHILQADNAKEQEILAMQIAAKGPLPPLRDLKNSKSYWLVRVDSDNRTWDPQPFQWQPGAKRWCRVGEYATGSDLNLTDWVVIAELEMPDFPKVSFNQQAITVFKK